MSEAEIPVNDCVNSLDQLLQEASDIIASHLLDPNNNDPIAAWFRTLSEGERQQVLHNACEELKRDYMECVQATLRLPFIWTEAFVSDDDYDLWRLL